MSLSSYDSTFFFFSFFFFCLGRTHWSFVSAKIARLENRDFVKETRWHQSKVCITYSVISNKLVSIQLNLYMNGCQHVCTFIFYFFLGRGVWCSGCACSCALICVIMLLTLIYWHSTIVWIRITTITKLHWYKCLIVVAKQTNKKCLTYFDFDPRYFAWTKEATYL